MNLAVRDSLVIFSAWAAITLWGCPGGSMSGDGGQDGETADADAAAGDNGQQAEDVGQDGGDRGPDPGDDPGGPENPCPPLAQPTGTIVRVVPAQASELRSIVAAAAAGTTIVLEDGFYAMDDGDAQSRLSFEKPDVTLRSASGNPERVVLDGAWVTGELVNVSASRVTIAEITLQRAYYHPIHVTGGAASIEGVRIYRVRVIDPAEQGIKINPSSGGTFADRGSVECCHIELTDSGRAQVRNNCYTGGIDGHQALGWRVRLNTIKGFWCQAGLSEHGVHFWTGSRDTMVERNVILDCARGVGFGLGDNGTSRTYPDNPYPGVGYIGHYDGVIRNNFIAASSAALFSSEYGFDAGIALEQARGAKVLHNSVVSTQAPFSSIEWRFDNTLAEVKNNMVSHNLRDRGGAAELAGNRENAPLGWFANPAAGDLHIFPSAEARDAGVVLPAGACDEDIDGQGRDSSPDIGADEYR